MILRFHKYLWYRLYRFNLESWNDSLVAASQSLAAVCSVVFFYILTVISWAQVIFPHWLIWNFIAALSKTEILGAGALIIIPPFLIWGLQGRYKKIVEEFDNLHETSREKVLRALGLWLYVFVWITLFVISLVILSMRS